MLVVLAAGCAQRPAEGTATYEGAAVRIIVGYAAGGGYDLHARLVARHLGRFLPGQPNVVVENMPGAGGAIAATYLSTTAAPDGLSLGILGEASAPALVETGLLEKLALLGSPGPVRPVIAFTQKSGIATVDDWRRAAVPPRIGASGGRALSLILPRIAAAALDLPMQLISGYAGTSEVRLAFETGEVDAYAFDESLTRSDQLGDALAVLRFGEPSHSSRNAADALSLAPDPAARRLIEGGIYAMRPFGRVYVAPRNVPAERLALLRAAFSQVFSDATFLNEANIAGLAIAPVTAEDLEAAAARLPHFVDDRLRDTVRVD